MKCEYYILFLICTVLFPVILNCHLRVPANEVTGTRISSGTEGGNYLTPAFTESEKHAVHLGADVSNNVTYSLWI